MQCASHEPCIHAAALLFSDTAPSTSSARRQMQATSMGKDCCNYSEELIAGQHCSAIAACNSNMCLLVTLRQHVVRTVFVRGHDLR